MLYALDTSILISLFKKESSVINKFLEISQLETISIPSYVFFEMLRGYEYLNARKKIKEFEDFFQTTFRPKVDELDVMRRAAKIYAERKRKGLSIQDGDILIAAWCLEVNAILVTDNTKHFKDIDGLQIENWKH